MNITHKAAARQQMPTFKAADLSQLLGRPIAYHRIFAHLTNDPGAALFLSQALYWTPRATHQNENAPAGDGWFFKTQAEWWQETGLSRYNQETARKKLRALGILEEKRAGQQGHIFFRLNLQVLAALLRSLLDNTHSQLEMVDSHSSNSHNPTAPAAKIPQLPSISETSTETTAPRRAKTRAAAAPPVANDDDGDVRLWLSGLGIGDARAKRLAAAHVVELTRRRKYLPYIENVRDAARLVTFKLEEPWDEPQAFRDQLAAEERAASRRVQQRQASTERATRKRDEAAVVDEGAALDAQLEAMPEEQRAAIERQAQEQRANIVRSGLGVAPPLQVLARNILRERLKESGR
jgi:hypothetical protein